MQPGKSPGEKDWEDEQAGSTSVLSKAISRPMEAKPAMKVAEEGADGRRVTGQDPIIEEEGGEVNRIRESGCGHTAGLEDDGVDGKCEECWS